LAAVSHEEVIQIFIAPGRYTDQKDAMGNLWFGLQMDPEKALSLPPLPAQPVVTEFKSLREGPAAREQQGKSRCRVGQVACWSLLAPVVGGG